LIFGHAIVVVVDVVDDGVVDVSFLMVNEVAMGLVKKKKLQNLENSFLDVTVISCLHCYHFLGLGALGLGIALGLHL
jgi:hypothetical protein